ncbi:glycerol-3-phosphate responsive antiterminator [Paenibacillus sp. KN14-4R]|uniref:glycerol-3-phosphate responsive antiterminator n=1 Tax=Paenibacillus sp. KN14-4R TaxID=3445773 RepID=UPI003FA02304
MHFMNQRILPAVRQMKDFEKLLASSYEYMIMLDIHISQIRSVFQLARENRKKLMLHVDLINGLQSDQYATEYLCQEFKPDGLLSTKASVILKAKEKGVLAIQRIFLLDNSALTKSYSLLEKTKPDYIEVMPGAMLHIIKEDKTFHTDIPILAGGFIRSAHDVEHALQLGAITVTTSNKDLWREYESYNTYK